MNSSEKNFRIAYQHKDIQIHMPEYSKHYKTYSAAENARERFEIKNSDMVVWIEGKICCEWYGLA